MKIALLGYGKMGKTIHKIAEERQHEVVYKTAEKPDFNEVRKADVAIEFSIPEAAFHNISTCLENKIPVISGTTGWLNRFNDAVEFAHANQAKFLYASNFSVGVNLFFKLNETLAKLMSAHQDYSVSMTEIHHLEKKDAPSGTAISLAEGILKNSDRYESWKLKEKGAGFTDSELKVEAFRIDEVPGTHIIEYESEIDKISLKHEAKSRSGFALGAVLAAEYAAEHSGILTMKDLLKFD